MTSEHLAPGIPPRGVITLAFGKQRYLNMGRSLGRSLRLNAPGLPSAVVTDSNDPELKALYTYVVPYRPDFGSDVRQKLHLDLYSPFAETLFIDSDCLVLDDLDSFWSTFAGQYFGVPGWRELVRGERDSYLDVDFILDRFNLQSIPKFNGGVYYFTRSEQAGEFFALVRDLLEDFNSYRFTRFRSDAPADEAIFSVAMAIRALRATSMGAGGMWTPASSRGRIKLDVQRRICSFEKEGRMVSPEVVHFAGEYASSFAYVRECLRLMRRFGGTLPPGIELLRMLAKSAAWECSHGARDIARRVLKGAPKVATMPG